LSTFRLNEYSPGVLEHYKNPRNVGELPEADCVGLAQGRDHGDVLRLAFVIEAGHIKEVRFKALGCPAAIASGSAATELLTGLTIDNALALTNQEVAGHLGGIPDSKMECSVLVQQAVQQALRPISRPNSA
jgi:NifU-like protein involved in Fe-S cluster formation